MIRKRNFTSMTFEDITSVLIKDSVTIRANTPVNELLEKFSANPNIQNVYVVDEMNKLIGVVNMTATVEFLFPFNSMILHQNDMTIGNMQSIRLQQTGQIMNTNPFYLKQGSTMYEAARILIEEKINELPVVNDDMTLIGQLNVYELIRTYLKEQNKYEN